MTVTLQSIRPNKINVLVLRQGRPLKISADGTFFIAAQKKNSNLPPNLSFQACR
jgi:hypothetical protein